MQKRILSIQSHVVHGYVGNKSAVFPLQLLGFDVDIINSVHFSNHTGHPNAWTGDVLNGTQLQSILEGLEQNHLLDHIGFLLTGYIGSESFLRAVLDVLKKLRATSNSHIRYVCDPVLGDGGQFYVPPDLVTVYKNELIPLADVVTPNQFEVEQLTGVTVKSMENAKRACEILHDLGPSLVFITSIILDEKKDKDQEHIKNITILASSRPLHSKNTNTSNTAAEMWRIDSPILPGRFTGTGDLCAALLLAWTEAHPNDLALAMEKVIGTMHAIIKRTVESYSLQKNNAPNVKNEVALKELKLIQSKNDIENPSRNFRAKRIL